MLKQVFKTIAAKNKIKGFTLVEVLIFISVISVVLITAASLALTSLFTFKNQQYQTLSEYYAVSLLNWLEGEKEKDWGTFLQRASAGGKTYCFNSDPINTWPSAGVCPANNKFGKPPIFSRQVKLTILQPGTLQERVQAIITVKWEGATGTEEKTINREFKQVEK